MTQNAFIAMVVISALIDFAVAALVLRFAARQRDGGRRIGFWEVFATILVSGLAFGVKLAVLGRMGLNFWGALCVTYVDLVIVLPLLALGLLLVDGVARWSGRSFRLTPMVRALAVLCVLAAPLAGIYATFFEPNNLRLERTTVVVPANRAGSQPIRIGVLADIQTNRVTRFEREAIAQLMAEKPDVIVIPGDLFDGFAEEFTVAPPEFRELLAQLHAPGGVFFVPGDVDSGQRIDALLSGTGIRVLNNQIVETRAGDRRLVIGGLELNYTTPTAQRLMDDLDGDTRSDTIRILLSHRPDSVRALPANSRIDLVIAGHTHGGQVRLPGIGPLMTLSSVPNRVAAGGLHSINGNRIYVSRGLGRERRQAPSIRFLCPPEITLLTLQD